MMTIHEIRKILKCSRATAESALRHANIHKATTRFAHGRKNFYDVTPDRLPEIMADYKRNPEKTALQQSAALSALEAVFSRSQQIGVRA